MTPLPLARRMNPVISCRPIVLLAALGLLNLFTLPPDALIFSEDAVGVEGEQTQESTIKRELFVGKVVLLTQALEERDLRVAEEMAGQAVLETKEGELIPILADWRGRAFFQDERLRDRKVELVAQRRKQLPYLQVLMVFTFDEDGQRQYTDYWCDVCSIPMYEIKPCECCQAEIRLRFQPQDLPEYLDLETTDE